MDIGSPLIQTVSIKITLPAEAGVTFPGHSRRGLAAYANKYTCIPCSAHPTHPWSSAGPRSRPAERYCGRPQRQGGLMLLPLLPLPSAPLLLPLPLRSEALLLRNARLLLPLPLPRAPLLLPSLRLADPRAAAAARRLPLRHARWHPAINGHQLLCLLATTFWALLLQAGGHLDICLNQPLMQLHGGKLSPCVCIPYCCHRWRPWTFASSWRRRGC